MAVVINGTTGITNADGGDVLSDADYTTIATAITPSITNIAATDKDNRIINGDMNIWQRGVSFTALAHGGDRWFNNLIGGTVTQSRQAFAVGETLGVNSPTFFLRQTVSGQTLPSHVALTQQYVESVRSYSGQTITVLGWARRSSGAGNMVVEAEQMFGSGGGGSASVANIPSTTITLTGSWAPFAAVIAVPSITGKTLGITGNDRLQINFWTSAGSDWNARSNALGLQTIGVDFWGIHIRLGTWTASATADYRPRDIGTELSLCQRYFEIVPVVAGSNGAWINAIGFCTTKRIIPTMTLVAGSLASGAFGADVNRITQNANSTGATGATIACDSEII